MILGPKGDKGEKGQNGEKGDKGNTGPIGTTGPKGMTGLKGNTGDKGNTGPNGPLGQKGMTGKDGKYYVRAHLYKNHGRIGKLNENEKYKIKSAVKDFIYQKDKQPWSKKTSRNTRYPYWNKEKPYY
ncbi:Hypothetical predicted protein [Mytilus galloprovincialis]|uniref:Uncharacterized protein n=1 Tax=Mytilus galloprovincialis TaxID=29158 RepID=A0A8B6G1N3_MYTGA|nr:Hypothetical predicted protein [Mytilus galloprovincialis]